MDVDTHREFDSILEKFVKHRYNNPMHYYYFETLFSLEEVSRIITTFAPLATEKAVMFKASAGRKTDLTWIPRNPTTQWIYDRMVGALVNSNNAMFKYEISGLKDKIQFGFYRGSENGNYRRHVDVNANDIHCCRKLSISVLLSNPDTYTGGDLIIKKIKAPRKQGSACVFSSFTEHEVTPVTEGDRLSLVLWIYGPPFR